MPSVLILAHGTRPDQSPWRWDPHLDVVVVLLAVTAVYVMAMPAIGRRLGVAEPMVSRRQTTLLWVALGTLWLFSVWPIHNLAEGFSYTVHMVQHTAYTLVVPPLLILGTPAWLWEWALRPVMPVFRRLVHPAVSVAIYSVVTTATHLPVLANGAVSSAASHFAQHLALVLAAVLVWWPLTSPVPELPRLEDPLMQMVYLFFVSLAPSVAGSSLIWARAPLYRTYEPFPHLFGLSTLADEQTGGMVMEIAEGLIIWGLIVAVMIKVAVADWRATNQAAPRAAMEASS